MLLDAPPQHWRRSWDAATRAPRFQRLAIKAYSPDLIVHPVLDAADPAAAIREWTPRLSALVIGPGLGRERRTLDAVARLIESLRPHAVPMVLGADALWLLAQQPDLVRGYHSAVLTPNPVEFGRLYRAVMGAEEDVVAVSHYGEQHARQLSREMGDVAIVKKGRDDLLVCGDSVLWCAEPGSARRCGGQGDILSGKFVNLLQPYGGIQTNESFVGKLEINC